MNFIKNALKYVGYFFLFCLWLSFMCAIGVAAYERFFAPATIVVAEKPAEPASVAMPTPSVAKQAFVDVHWTLDALGFVGIGKMRDWRKDEMGEYGCASPYYEYGEESSFNTLRSNFAMYANSKDANSIEDVELMLNANNEHGKKTDMYWFSYYQEQIPLMLEIGVDKELKRLIATHKPYVYENDKYRFVTTLEQTRIECWRYKITKK